MKNFLNKNMLNNNLIMEWYKTMKNIKVKTNIY